jgi:hypothetical protein
MGFGGVDADATSPGGDILSLGRSAATCVMPTFFITGNFGGPFPACGRRSHVLHLAPPAPDVCATRGGGILGGRPAIVLQTVRERPNDTRYRLVIRDGEGWAGILPDLERIAPPRIRIDETLVLLVLRRLWEEGVRDGDMQARGAVLLVVEMRHPDGWKIGRAAAGLTLEALHRALDAEAVVQKRHAENVSLLENVQRHLEQLTVPAPDEDRLERLAACFADRTAQIEAFRAQLAAIEDRIDPSLQREHDGVRQRMAALTKEKDALLLGKGRLEGEITGVRNQLGAGDEIPGSRLSLSLRRGLFRQQVGAIALFAAVRLAYEDYAGARKRGRPAEIAADMHRQSDDFTAQYRNCETDIRDRINDYRRQFNANPPIGTERRIVADFKPWAEEDIAALEGTQLVQYQRQADAATDQIERLLRTGSSTS